MWFSGKLKDGDSGCDSVGGLFDLGGKQGEKLGDGVIQFGQVCDGVAEVSDGGGGDFGAGHGVIIPCCPLVSNLIPIGGDRCGGVVAGSWSGV